MKENLNCRRSRRSGVAAVIRRVFGLMLLCSTGTIGQVAFDDSNPSHLPVVDGHQLRIISPTLLELTLIQTKDRDPARVAEWDFLDVNGQLVLPAASQFSVTSNQRQLAVVSLGFKRRPVYAPLKKRDLRIASHLYLKLGAPVADSELVEVTNPTQTLWASTRRFVASADPLRFNPAIHVNQEGYLPTYPKKATVSYYLGSAGEMTNFSSLTFRLVNAQSGAAVFSGNLVRRLDVGYTFSPAPYQQVWEADFTAFQTSGEYRLQVPGLGASFSFLINEGIAGLFTRTYALGLYHQRCGTGNDIPFTRHHHGPCHTNSAEVPDMSFSMVNFFLNNMSSDYLQNPDHTAPQLRDVNSSLYPFVNTGRVDVAGGHHDAGDYSKYTINVAALIHALVFAADAFPGAADLDNLGLPESADNKSDLLQEARWEADFLCKMQDADGGFYFLVYPKNRAYEDNVLPDRGDAQVVFPKTTAATAAAVAALAQIASSPRFKQEFPGVSTVYLDKARRGWDFLQQAIARHGRNGSYQKISHYGNEFMHHDELAWAAAELYLATGDPIYHNELRTHFDPGNAQTRRWGWWRLFEGYGCAVRSYAFAVRTGRLRLDQLDAAYLGKCEAEIRATSADQVRFARENAFGTSFPDPSKAYRSAGWYFSLDQAFDIAVGYQLEARYDQLEALLSNMNFEAGSNPLNLSYLTGTGWKRQREVVHQYAQNDHRMLPPSGLPQGNIQGGLPYLENYKNSVTGGNELPGLCYPSDWATTAPYAPYETWADTFNTSTEFVNPQQARGLAALSFLMGRTSLKDQPWRSGIVQITGLPGQNPAQSNLTANLQAVGIDLSTARIVWEGRDLEPTFGRELVYAPALVGPQWLEAEILFPDGRRLFARSNYNATFPPHLPANSYQSTPQQAGSDIAALFHFDNSFADTAGKQGALAPAGNISFDPGNVGWMGVRTGASVRFNDLGDKVVGWVSGADLSSTNRQAISLEAMIYLADYKGFNRGNSKLLSLSNAWNATLEFVEDQYFGPKIVAGQQLLLEGSRVTEALPRNQWHHLRISLDRTGYSVAVNGNVIGSLASSDLNNWSSSRNSRLEAGNFEGWVDEVVVKKIQSGTIGNSAPSASIISPSTGANLLPTNVTIVASASDSDGAISKVEFFLGTSKLGEDASAPYTWLWTNLLAGNYTLTARAIDNGGASTISLPVSVAVSSGTVTNATVQTPSIAPNGGNYTNSVSVSLACVTAAATIRYTANGSDPTATSALYNGAFTISSSATVKARAFKAGSTDSAVAAASLTIISNASPTRTRATFVKEDTTTKGNWKGVYGSNGYQVIGNVSSEPSFAQVTASGKSGYTWSLSTTNPVALQKMPGPDRILSCWFSPTTFEVAFQFTDNLPHRVALYCLDWSTTDRAQTLEVFDGVSGALLSSQTISNFFGGKYLIWEFTGNIKVRFSRIAGDNAVLMGYFFDPPVNQPTLKPVNFNSAVASTNGLLVMTVAGDPGQRIVLESSIDLKQWQPVSTNTFSSATLELRDPTPPGNSRRFYRCVVVP